LTPALLREKMKLMKLPLRIFNALPQHNQNWWILQTLRDPAVLPLLGYWSTLLAPNDQQQMLEHVIASLENRSPRKAPGATVCCEATEECLLQHLKENSASAAIADVEIHSEDEARKWLVGGAEPADFNIRYRDDLKRSAIVRRSDGSEENWQYLYDCWRRTDKPSDRAAR
jgi:hypothetical protein